MPKKTVIKSALRHIDEISNREFLLVVLICIVVAAFNAVFVAYKIGYLDGRVSCGYPCVAGHQDFSRDVMRVKNEIALLIVVLALWFRRVFGLIISFFATLFVGIQYALWYVDTQRWLREMGVTDFSKLPVPSEIPHFAGLYRSTKWDVVLLVVVTALILWHVRVLTILVGSARENNKY